MSGNAGGPSRPRPTMPTGRARALLPALAVLVVLLLVFWGFTGIYTQWLWFDSIGFTSVLRKEILTKTLLFVVFGGLLAAAVVVNFVIAFRTRPVYAVISPEQQSLERYRSAIAPYRKWLAIGPAVGLGLLSGSSAASQWQMFLLWRNGVSFGQVDAQFGRDISFYAFSLPFYRFLLGFLFTALVLSLIVAAATHYLYGGLRLQGSGERTTAAARVHLSVLLGLFVLAKGVAYWLDRYNLAVLDNGRTIGNNAFTGLKYTDVHAVLGGKYALSAIAVICALLFFMNIVRRTWMLPGIGVGLFLVSAVLVGGVLPTLVQAVQVKPSEQARENEYIDRNIKATRAAYDIESAVVEDYTPPTTNASATQVTAAKAAPGIRMLDPFVVSPTFRQNQQIRPYYRFPPKLDIGRYPIDGKQTDVVIGAREIDISQQPTRNWNNDHLVYTHGYGLVAARSESVEANGSPSFVEKDLPADGSLPDYEPRIYFGEYSPEYSIVGAPAGAQDRELDYPASTAEVNTTYKGAGGVAVGSFLRKALYAVKFQEEKILLSNQITGESKILYDREPRERIEKVAPWLTLDTDPYPAVVDGKIQWIVDAYTTSAGYPYSLHTQLDQTTGDSLATRSAVPTQAAERVNYIRNSVKATVDAYDGTVKLYAWDENDPVLKTWRSAFPGVVLDKSAITPSLNSQLRYPQDLFKVQRTLLGNYHQTDPDQFYSGSDFWEVPEDPSVNAAQRALARQPAYYLPIQMPNQTAPVYSLTSAFVPRDRETPLTALASVGSEGADYGKIRVLRMPSTTQAPGPEQFVATFESNSVVRDQLSQLRIGGAEVQLGNVLTLPVGGGLLYVAPIYVRQTNSPNPYPLLQNVAVSFGGDKVGFAKTLPDAIAELGSATGTGGTGGTGGGGTSTPTPTPTPGASSTPTGSALSQALQQAGVAASDSDAALKESPPDWVAFGDAQKRLREALARAAAAQASPSPTANASPTPSLTPSAAATTAPPS